MNITCSGCQITSPTPWSQEGFSDKSSRRGFENCGLVLDFNPHPSPVVSGEFVGKPRGVGSNLTSAVNDFEFFSFLINNNTIHTFREHFILNSGF